MKLGSVVQQPNQCSTAKSMKQFHGINRLLGVPVSQGGEAKSKRCVLRCFLKVATEMDEQTDCGRLFQREGVRFLKKRCKKLCKDVPIGL